MAHLIYWQTPTIPKPETIRVRGLGFGFKAWGLGFRVSGLRLGV